MDGIFRGYFVSVNEADRISQVFIPTLHRKLMPFKNCDPKAGLIDGIDLKAYPLATFCCPGVFVTPSVGDTAWIAFENGDPKFPVVIGQIGTALPEGDVVTAIYGGGTGSATGLYTGTGGGGYLTGCAKCTLDGDAIEWIATCMYGEGGGSDLHACREYASHAANLVEETFGADNFTQENVLKRVDKYGNSKYAWYASASWTRGCSDEARQAVKEVFIEGKRYLPRFVVEFDCFPHDAWNNEYQEDKSKYKQGETEINQRPVHYVNGTRFGFSNPSNYMFWLFFKSGDVGGYKPDGAMYEKYKDDPQKMQQTAVSGGGNKAAEEFIKIMNAGYRYGRGANQHDCSSSTCEALYQAGILPSSGKNYTTTSFGSGGSKFIEYGFVDVTKEVWPTGNKSSYSNMQPGDILWCYDAHMTMYVGDGKIGLMSSSSGCRLGNYYPDSRITNVFRYSGGNSK